MKCFFCSKTESHSGLGDPVFAQLWKIKDSTSARHDSWTTQYEPKTYKPGEIYSGSFKDELGGTVSIVREFFETGQRMSRPARSGKSISVITIVDTVVTRLQVEVLRCRTCEAAYKSKARREVAVGVVVTGLVSISIAALSAGPGFISNAVVLGFSCWVMSSALWLAIAKMWRRDRFPGQLSTHPVISVALREGFTVLKTYDQAFSTEIPSLEPQHFTTLKL